MASKKDQLQAYQFLVQRVVSALAVQETDPEHPPYRRPTIAAIGGVAIVVVALLVVWVFGLVVPGGGRQFSDAEVVAVEKETGARHVLIDGKLHQVANFTSALLALDKPAAVKSVSRRSLEGVPRGPRIGIQEAPDALPGTKQLLTGGWSSCSRPGLADTGARTDESLLLVGHSPTGGTALDGRALLVRSGDTRYVVAQGYRHEVGSKADLALDLGRESEVVVSPRWLDTLPRGRPLAPIAVAGVGGASTVLPQVGLRVGELVERDDGSANGAEGQLYLVLPRQLQPLTALEAQLQRVADGAGLPVPVNGEEIARTDQTGVAVRADGDLPRARPQFAAVDDPRAPVCASFDPGSFVPRLVVGPALDAAAAQNGVVVPPGKGALVEVVAAPDQPPGQGTVALVTDDGRLYPLATPDHVKQVLGYDAVNPVRVAQSLAARLVPGPSLDPAAARLPATG